MNLKRFLLLKLRRLLSDKSYIQLRYLKSFKSFPNLKNPKTFNEKINWLKLYYKNAELTKFVDKYNVRAYIARKIGQMQEQEIMIQV